MYCHVALKSGKVLGACLRQDRDPHSLYKWDKSMEEQGAGVLRFELRWDYLAWWKVGRK